MNQGGSKVERESRKQLVTGTSDESRNHSMQYLVESVGTFQQICIFSTLT